MDGPAAWSFLLRVNQTHEVGLSSPCHGTTSERERVCALPAAEQCAPSIKVLFPI